MMLWLMATRVAFAGWEFTPPGDPNRNWATTVTLRGIYNDNFWSTEKNRQSGLQLSSDMALRATVPLERLFMGLNYDYGVAYPRDIKLGGINETHNLTFGANYTYSPRLTLSVNENYVSSIQPQLVQTQAGVPVTVVQAGDYTYNNAGGNLNYALTPGWSLSLNGNWDIWRYQVPSYAQSNDREDYQTTLSAVHVFGPRTFAGVNYQYGQNIFVNPGTNNILNAQWHTGYLSLVERLNPRLSLQLNGGYTIRESGDGTVSTAPSAYGSLAYNYGPDDTISLTVGHALTEATAIAMFTRQFSASENTTVAFLINHRLTVRLRAAADVSYVLSSFEVPVSVLALSGQAQSFSGHLGVSYAFRDWLSVVLDYYYTRYTQSMSGLPGFSFDRNQVGLGLSLTY
jgi:hypothetical protein